MPRIHFSQTEENSQGRTEEEALENIKDAITECLAVHAEALPLSVEIRTIEIAD